MISLLLRRFTVWLALAGLAVTGVLVNRMRGDLSAVAPPPPVQPAANPYGTGLGAAGLVEARRENTAVGAPQPGLVAAVHVAVWDRVEVGQPLFTLDGREFDAALLLQTANVAVAEAQLLRLREQLDRLEAVDDVRAITLEELRSRRSDVRVAEAQLQAARGAEAQTRALLARLVVRAPISGTILQSNLRVGEYLTPSSTMPPLVLGDIATFQIRAEIDEQLAGRIRPEARATAFIKGDAQHSIPLTFVRIEPFVVPKRSLTGSSSERVDTRVLQVIYSFPADERPVYVGQQMDIFIAGEVKP
jgi:RND family efflux transporter MFP subunit